MRMMMTKVIAAVVAGNIKICVKEVDFFRQTNQTKLLTSGNIKSRTDWKTDD